MVVKFNNSDDYIKLAGCVLYQNKVRLCYGIDMVEDNLSGFKLYEDDEETIVRDCSNYVYKWNIYTEYEDGIMLTESETDREREPNPNAEPPREIVDPLTNDELTECVAELMYDESMRELGI